jgi:hypothetical protein
MTKREARRPYSATLRTDLKFSITLKDTDLRIAEGVLRSMTTEKVIVPFWPAVSTWANRVSQAIKGGLFVVYKYDWSQFDIYDAGSEPLWPAAGDFVAPALMGYLSRTTKIQMLNPITGVYEVQFSESSPAGYELLVTAPGFTNGPLPSGYGSAPVLLPFQSDFRQVTEQITLDVARTQIGFDREQQPTFYPHAAYRQQQSQYTLSAAEIPSLLVWFQTVGGPGQSFWAAGAFVTARMSAPATAIATTLNVYDTYAIKSSDYLCMVSNRVVTGFAKVNTVFGASVSNATGLGVAVNTEDQLFTLYLASLDQPKVSVDWKSTGLVIAKMNWTEMVPERDVAGYADETLGVTIGHEPVRVAFVQLSRDLRNGTILNWYYTSFESDITWSTHTWLHGLIGVGEITQSINLENDQCVLEAFLGSGTPLDDELKMISEAPLTAKIWFADYDPVGLTVSNANVVFFGDATTPVRKGNKITLTCEFGPSLLNTFLPRLLKATTCSHVGGSNNDGSFLISAGCTLLKADWKFTAQVANPVSSAFPFTLNYSSFAGAGASATAALAANAVFLNFLAGGWVEWKSGANIQRRQIVGSTVPTVGAGSLTLHRWFSATPLNTDALVIYPGCDGLWTTCQAYNSGTNPTGKFNNKVNFGGEPFRPAINPSMNGLVSSGVNTAKK